MSLAPLARRELPLRAAPAPQSSSLPLGADGPLLKLDDFFRRISYVTLKVTNGCNLHCAYCNVEALTPQTPRMSLERFKQVAELLIVHSRQPSLTLEFHGGEPLLLPDEWYAEALAYAQGLARRHNRLVEF